MATAKQAENERPSFYATTPIYYVNDYPHIGHIYTTLVVDTMARWRRLKGERVYFLTGTDEHGQKIEKAAGQLGIPPIALADQVVERYHSWWRLLGLSNDDFIRTTEKRHEIGVLEIIRRIAERGDLYSSHHEGLYCVGCETFYTEKELLPGNRCPVHETVCEERSEDNVFFRLAAYQDALLAHYEAHPEFIQPETRRNEVKQFVASGLRDLSVSRTNVSWGIPFPGHPGHTVYVWLDALTNYITALGFGRPGEGGEKSLYHRLWEDGSERVHVVGKDILRFHAVYWPAFLMSAGLPLPTTVWAHGWWLRDGQKMSKSVGNVVRPDHLVEKFGADPLRYFLLREMVFGQDGVFSDEGFVDRYNSDLANDLGNTLSRVVTVSRKAFGERLPPRRGDALRENAEKAVADYRAAMDEWAFQDALRALFRLLQETNQYLVANEPWKRLADPENLDQVSEVLWSSAEALRIVAAGLLPILPVQAPLLLAALQAPLPDGVAGLAWGQLATGAPLPAVEPLFPRVDKKIYLAEIAATRGGAPLAAAATAAAEPPKKKEKKVSDTAADKTADAPAPAPESAVAPAAGPATITIDQFMAVELKVATVRAAERVPKSDKLIRLTVDVGEGADRTVVAGIGKQYEPEELQGRQVVVVANLAPAKLMGIESNGMVLAASPSGLPVLLRPLEEVPPGTRVR